MACPGCLAWLGQPSGWLASRLARPAGRLAIPAWNGLSARPSPPSQTEGATRVTSLGGIFEQCLRDGGNADPTMRVLQCRPEEKEATEETRSFEILSITAFRKWLTSKYPGYDRHRLGADVVAMCCLAGNDFLPHMEGVNIYEGLTLGHRIKPDHPNQTCLTQITQISMTRYDILQARKIQPNNDSIDHQGVIVTGLAAALPPLTLFHMYISLYVSTPHG